MTEETEYQNVHLFVLIHGLWGGPKHMRTIDHCIKTLLNQDKDQRKIVTLKSSSFRFWKSYDGLKLNAEKVLSEILYEIETLKSKNKMNVDRISIVGYSLGGLVSRYLIGLLYELEFFNVVKPVFFSTFATPHVGIEFFNGTLFDGARNNLGKVLFGKSGKEMFLVDQTLVDMADPELKYYKGLVLFEKHILLANVRNDRTVSFFTSYISDYSPFEDWAHVKIEYIADLPVAKVYNSTVKPKFVDITRSHKVSDEDLAHFEGNIQEELSIWTGDKYVRISIFSLVAMIYFPIFFPVVLTTTTVVSIYSLIKIKYLKPPLNRDHWGRVLDSVYGTLPIDSEDALRGEYERERRKHLETREYIKGDTSGITESAMNNLMYAEEALHKVSSNNNREVDLDDELLTPETDDLSDLEESETRSLVNRQDKIGGTLDIDTAANDAIIKEILPSLQIKDLSSYPLFKRENRLKVGPQKRFIIDNLNKINWVKIPVYLDCLNAHDSIIGRRGPKSNPRGTSTVSLWCSILRTHLEAEPSTV